jgi:hypothetical protein
MARSFGDTNYSAREEILKSKLAVQKAQMKARLLAKDLVIHQLREKLKQLKQKQLKQKREKVKQLKQKLVAARGRSRNTRKQSSPESTTPHTG